MGEPLRYVPEILVDEDGLGLMEVIVALGLVIFLLFLAYSLYFFGVDVYLNNTTSIENMSNVRIAMDHITYHVRRSNEVRLLGRNLIIGNEFYWLREDNVLMNKDNHLSFGISAFIFRMPNPETLEVTISSVPDRKGQIFTLRSNFYLMDLKGD